MDETYEALLRQLKDQEILLNYFKVELEDADEQDLSDVLYLITHPPIETGFGKPDSEVITIILD